MVESIIIKSNFFPIFIRPHLEISVQSWRPWQKYSIELLELAELPHRLVSRSQSAIAARGAPKS